MTSPGALFRKAIATHSPLPCLGTINAYSALLASKVNVPSLYLSGSGVATSSHGLPDLGITNLNDVCIDINRITSAVPHLPLLVDIDTGFGGALGIQRCIQQLIKNGAAAAHIEDQVIEKRCGHRPGKEIVSVNEMIDRIKICVKTRNESTIDSQFVIMARTDAFASEGMDGLLKRCEQYVNIGGADMLFPEALSRLEDYQALNEIFGGQIPILANITEFGNTPLFSRSELFEAGVSIVLYPLSAHRAMAKAAFEVYGAIMKDGHQKNCLQDMQTREELYEVLNYHKYEQMMDDLFDK